MPVEIKELVIRAVVNDTSDVGYSGSENESSRSSSASAGATDATVQECVRQVMRILAKNKER